MRTVPTVSVIIPTHNRAALIGGAIQSVLDQTYQDFEIIVVDDGSTDNTQETLEPFQSRIRYFHQENQGPSSARNTGIKRAEGKYIAFLDSDDLWLPSKLHKQMTVFHASPGDLGVVYCGVYYVDRQTEVTIKTTIPNYKGNVFDVIINKGSGPTTSASVVKKECFEKVGMFDETLVSYEDTDLWLRISQYYTFDYVEECLVRFLRNHRQLTTDGESFLRGRERFLDKYAHILPRLTKSKLYYMIGNAYFLRNEMKIGRRSMVMSVVSYPLFFKSYLCLFVSLFGHYAYCEIRGRKQKLLSR